MKNRDKINNILDIIAKIIVGLFSIIFVGTFLLILVAAIINTPVVTISAIGILALLFWAIIRIQES